MMDVPQIRSFVNHVLNLLAGPSEVRAPSRAVTEIEKAIIRRRQQKIREELARIEAQLHETTHHDP